MHAQQIKTCFTEGIRIRSKMEEEGRQDANRVDSRWKDVPYLKIGNLILKADFDEGDEYFREKARDELRETPEIVEQSLKDLRTMVKGNERDNVEGKNGGVSIPLPSLRHPSIRMRNRYVRSWFESSRKKIRANPLIHY